MVPQIAQLSLQIHVPHTSAKLNHVPVVRDVVSRAATSAMNVIVSQTRADMLYIGSGHIASNRVGKSMCPIHNQLMTRCP